MNPLVNWVWFGFGMLAFGTGIALLPERTYSFALAKMPESAATGTVALLLIAGSRRRDACLRSSTPRHRL